MNTTTNNLPEVGTPCTIICGTDKYPATVVGTRGKTVIQVKKDDFERIDNNCWSEKQVYAYTQNLNNKTEEFSLKVNGLYVKKDCKYTFLKIGIRQAYIDPNF